MGNATPTSEFKLERSRCGLCNWEAGLGRGPPSMVRLKLALTLTLTLGSWEVGKLRLSTFRGHETRDRRHETTLGWDAWMHGHDLSVCLPVWHSARLAVYGGPKYKSQCWLEAGVHFRDQWPPTHAWVTRISIPFHATRPMSMSMSTIIDPPCLAVRAILLKTCSSRCKTSDSWLTHSLLSTNHSVFMKLRPASPHLTSSSRRRRLRRTQDSGFRIQDSD